MEFRWETAPEAAATAPRASDVACGKPTRPVNSKPWLDASAFRAQPGERS